MELKVKTIIILMIGFLMMGQYAFSEQGIVKRIKIAQVEASSVQEKDPTKGETYGPLNVKDGAPWTRWSSRFEENQWLVLTLKQSEWISKIAISWQDAYASDYSIQVEKDTGEVLDIFSTQKGDGGEDVIEFNPVLARKVKLIFNKRTTEWGFSIWEIQIFCDKNEA